MNYLKEFRTRELLLLFYRVFLVYVFYQIARFLFWFYNASLIKVDSIGDYLSIAYHGIAFDTTAILYLNSLFILLSLIPAVVNTSFKYQKFLFWIYFITNGIGYLLNFIDFIYFKFSQTRLTLALLQVAKNESNILKVFIASIVEYPSIVFLFIFTFSTWIFLYRRITITPYKPKNYWGYAIFSIINLCIIATLMVGGIRGDFKHSTRPINMVDANKFTKIPIQGNLVLNSTFSFLRTLNTSHFKEVNFVDRNFIDKYIHPYKIYENKPPIPRPNIVIFIVESLGREYMGEFNKTMNINEYQSYTPFLDSLSREGLIFPNSFANGRQSIHGMSSILAGIPALQDAFTSSPYANQKIQSIVSICNELGYNTSFYHGAPNGSMGFQGFANILGFHHYFGKNEYNNDADWDGIWSIWDEPFLQYFANNIGKQQPFMATVFTASSHHPYNIPKKYKGKFLKGNVEMHEPIQYTDYALKKYFETAKQQDWFKNTIFVFTGDHTNQSFYKEYQNSVNIFAVPIIFYSPNPQYQLKGISNEIAQQMDIYPTLVNLIGYQKPIRSWGRSLVTPEKYPHIIVNSDGTNTKVLIKDKYYLFDGEDVIGIYQQNDWELKENLLSQLKDEETRHNIRLAKAWYQDYMYRVIRRKLG